MGQSLQRALAHLPSALGVPPRHMAPAWIAKPRATRPDRALEVAIRAAAVWLFVITAANLVWHAAVHLR